MTDVKISNLVYCYSKVFYPLACCDRHILYISYMLCNIVCLAYTCATKVGPI